MANVFDQFEAQQSEPQATGNVFDQFEGQPSPMQPFEGANPEAARIVTELNSGDITPAEGFMQATALGIPEKIAEWVGYLPEQVKEIGINAAKSMIAAIPSPAREAGAYVGEKIGEGYESVKEYNPRLFNNLEAATTILATAAPAIGHSADLFKAKKVMGDMVKSDSTDGILAKYRTNAAGLTVKDKYAVELMNNGVNPGVVRVIQLAARPVSKPKQFPSADDYLGQKATPQQPTGKGLISVMQPPKPPKPPSTELAVAGGGRNTQSKLMEMTQVKKRGMTDEVYRIDNKAADIVGDSVKERFDYVLRKNKEAAGKMRVAANGLKGKEVNVTNALEGFRKDMMDMDVMKNIETGDLDFSKSAVKFNPTAKKLINQVTNELMPIVERGGMANAYEMHVLKQAIDDLVSYGKGAEGLKGKTESVLKNLRKNIDTELDNNFGFYNAVNQQYADTVGLLDEFQRLVGTRVDLTAKNADSAIGRSMRALTNNTQNRTIARNLIEDLQTTAEKYGAKFNDDILPQVMYANELDRVFGVDTPTSIGGIVEGAVTKATEGAIGMAGAAATGDSIAMMRQAQAMAGRRPKPIHEKNKELFDLLEKTIKGEK